MKKSLLFLIVAGMVLLSPVALAEEEGGEEPAPGEPGDDDYIAPPADEGPPEGDFPELPPQLPEPQEPEPQDFGGQEVPEGCKLIQTGTGITEMECGFEEKQFEEFDVKDKIEECKGKFELINGSPACIKEGKKELVGVTCPTGGELSAVKANCNGNIEEFTDPNGCNSVMCINKEFKEEFNEKIEEHYGDDPLKVAALKCQKDGGEFLMIDSQPKCMGFKEEPMGIKGKLGAMGPEDVKQATQKMKGFEESVGAIAEKLEAVKELYESEGKTEQAKAIEYGLEKLDGVKEKIEEIGKKMDFENMTVDKRKEIMLEIQELRQEVRSASTAVLQGKVPTMEEMEQAVADQFDRFYGSPFGSKEEFQAFVEAEKGAIEIVQSCHKYSAENPKSFMPPDPEGFVVDVTLYFNEAEECMISLTTRERKTAQYTVEDRKFEEFNGPKALVGLPCSGECEKLNAAFTATHGTTPEEICAEECIMEGCSLGMMQCMEKNIERCEVECGLRKEGEGPFGPGGELDPMQACVMVCIGEEAERCEPGGSNPVCNECEEKCTDAYGPGIGYEKCLSGEQLDALENECIAQGMYGETIEETVMDTVCITGVTCVEYDESEWGDDPGTGPDSWEEGHDPGGDYGPPVGEAIVGNAWDFVTKWIGSWFK